MIEIKEMHTSDIDRVAEIDRSEHVTLAYTYQDGKLESEQVDWPVPNWAAEGNSEHSVQAKVAAWRPYLEQGGTLFGALNGDRLVGLAIYRPKLTATTAQLAVLHVSNGYRRKGIAARLTTETVRLARQDGARDLYVSATPSKSAVGFYQSQGFQLIDEPHPELYALEPEDIHIIKPLSGATIKAARAGPDPRTSGTQSGTSVQAGADGPAELVEVCGPPEAQLSTSRAGPDSRASGTQSSTVVQAGADGPTELVEVCGPPETRMIGEYQR
jgi:ribosomal protein S18 acetylase RimI-like enzyme